MCSKVYHWQPCRAVEYSGWVISQKGPRLAIGSVKFFQELKRRNVFRVAAGYIIVAWLVLQVSDVLMGVLELPSWTGRFVFFTLVIGFPLVIAFSWIFQLTPEGLRRESDISAAETDRRPSGGRSDTAIILLLVAALGYFIADKFYFSDLPDTSAVEVASQPEKSIAVLPFVTSGEEEGELFATGIHDDLLTQLAKVAELHVISRTSMMEYAETTKNMTQIGKELGVSHILEGGVQKIGDQVRINAQLIDARLDKHLWAETFDRELSVRNIFKVQSEIVQLITGSLQATLLAGTEASIETPPTENMDAYRDYLAALSLANRRDTRIELLQSAVNKDPQFALAWIQMAYEWQQIFWFDPEQPEALAKAEEALARAEAIDADLPQLHRTRAMVLYHGYLDHEGALRELEMAEKGLPGDSTIFEWRATIYRHMQRIPEAVAVYRHALALDPRNAEAVYELGIALSLGRYFEQERALWEQSQTDFPEGSVGFNWLLATVDWAQHGDSQSQLKVMNRPDWPKYERDEALFALKHWQAGEMSEALRYAHEINPNEEDEARVFVPTFARIPKAYSEVIQAGILIANGFAVEADEILNTARARIEKEISSSADPYWWAFADLGGVLAVMGEAEAARAANTAMVEAFDQPERTYQLTVLHQTIMANMCILGDFSEVETQIRWLLSRPTGGTLASLVNEWPPCRQQFEGTEHFRRLQEEFGHLGQGKTLD